ncbi:MAG: 6-phosphogluconolactonase, partial [Planktothrix sp.]
MEKNIEILANREELIDRALEILLAKIAEALENRDQFTIALAGGSTPKPLYEALSRQLLPWDKIHIFWGDERYVAPDHPDSNQKMAAQAWLDRVNLPATNIHPMPTLANNPIADAEQYNRELVQFFALNAGEFPAFDVVLLGMGDDAHTASLFPHT